jgi:hypothetical protein
VLNAAVREVVTANGGSIVGEEYSALDRTDYGATVERIGSAAEDDVDVVVLDKRLAAFACATASSVALSSRYSSSCRPSRPVVQ